MSVIVNEYVHNFNKQNAIVINPNSYMQITIGSI